MTEEFGGTIGRTYADSEAWWPPLPGAGRCAERRHRAARRRRATRSSAATAPTSPRRASTGSPATGTATRTSTPPRCARRRARACSPAATTTRNGMARIVEFAAGLPRLQRDDPARERLPLRDPRAQRLRHLRGRASGTSRPASEMTMGSPRDKWPLGRGFERFYGFMGGETDQYHPELVYDNHHVEPPRTPEEGYHLTEDLADKAILFLKDLRATAPDKPFFLWFTPGACHAPHQAPADVHRAATAASSTRAGTRGATQVFARQVESGLLPAGHAAVGAPVVGAGVGLAHRRRAPPLRPDDGGLRRLPHPHRRAGAAACSTSSTSWASSTTRS